MWVSEELGAVKFIGLGSVTQQELLKSTYQSRNTGNGYSKWIYNM